MSELEASQGGGEKATSLKGGQKEGFAREILVEKGACVGMSHWSVPSLTLLTLWSKDFVILTIFLLRIFFPGRLSNMGRVVLT